MEYNKHELYPRLVLAAIVVIGIIIAAIFSSHGSKQNAENQTYHQRSHSFADAEISAYHSDVEAFTVAEHIVKLNLKTPSTAKFCKITEATISNKGYEYTVKGYVDAQNLYGAMVRYNFTVKYTALWIEGDIGYKNETCVFD